MNLTIQDAINDVVPNAKASGLAVSVCNIQQPDGSFTAGGEATNTFVPVAGLQNIQCINAPPRVSSVGGTETKMASEVLAYLPRHVLLLGSFPQISLGRVQDWQAVIDGTAYDILSGGESDSQGTQTRMEVRLASI